MPLTKIMKRNGKNASRFLIASGAGDGKFKLLDPNNTPINFAKTSRGFVEILNDLNRAKFKDMTTSTFAELDVIANSNIKYKEDIRGILRNDLKAFFKNNHPPFSVPADAGNGLERSADVLDKLTKLHNLFYTENGVDEVDPPLIKTRFEADFDTLIAATKEVCQVITEVCDDELRVRADDDDDDVGFDDDVDDDEEDPPIVVGWNRPREQKVHLKKTELISTDKEASAAELDGALYDKIAAPGGLISQAKEEDPRHEKEVIDHQTIVGVYKDTTVFSRSRGDNLDGCEVGGIAGAVAHFVVETKVLGTTVRVCTLQAEPTDDGNTKNVLIAHVGTLDRTNAHVAGEPINFEDIRSRRGRGILADTLRIRAKEDEKTTYRVYCHSKDKDPEDTFDLTKKECTNIINGSISALYAEVIPFWDKKTRLALERHKDELDAPTRANYDLIKEVRAIAKDKAADTDNTSRYKRALGRFTGAPGIITANDAALMIKAGARYEAGGKYSL